MERYDKLTYRDNDGIVKLKNSYTIPQTIDRLAEYEDTGLSPEEVKELKAKIADGRVMELPCKVGDTVYRVIRHCTEQEFGDCYGCSRNIDGRCQPKFFEQAFSVGLFNEVNKTVFLTKSEAESALKGE